ncbi:BLUF domain-containing protein [Nitrosomonas sp.]|uniref:BLUF domain-containing protein n=1 Tax=Nitrosomonas sp. TaxID=42353 RepID=UPI001D27C863|nr:BLUF domain-containing protein [Nitrosomonas sp.]MCB1947428.1 BLUF domain-containing protein [Nitrosomonas sp.]MDR4513199.1 BLUF domain-containing protein [Nitrosomonas sp.]
MRELYRLIYLSHNEITGNSNCIHREIGDILAISRKLNADAGITGALMFNKNCFAQILEGAHHRIQETFERIQCDPRHSRVAILDFKPIQNRSFAHWSMAYVGQENLAAQEFMQIQKDSEFDMNRLTGETIFSLLRSHLYAAEQDNSCKV